MSCMGHIRKRRLESTKGSIELDIARSKPQATQPQATQPHANTAIPNPALEPVRPRTCPFFLYRGGIPFTAPFLYGAYRGGKGHYEVYRPCTGRSAISCKGHYGPY
jgi:hypothetical protein